MKISWPGFALGIFVVLLSIMAISLGYTPIWAIWIGLAGAVALIFASTWDVWETVFRRIWKKH